MRTQELTHSVDDNPAVASAVLRSPKERNLADLLHAKLDLVVALSEIAETTNDGQRRAQLLFKMRQAIHTVRRLAAGIADQAAWRMIHEKTDQLETRFATLRLQHLGRRTPNN